MKNAKKIDKGNKITRGAKFDPDTDAMISEVASAENRNISNSIIRLVRIGHRYWKKNAQQRIACM